MAWDPNKKLVQDAGQPVNMAGQNVNINGQNYTMQGASSGNSVNPINNTPILNNASQGDTQTTTRGNPLTSGQQGTAANQSPTADKPLTAEELAKQDRNEEIGVIQGQMKKVNEVADSFGLAKSPETIQGAVDEFKAKQAKEKTALEQELARQKSLDVAQEQKFNEQARGSIGATSAAYAQDREGAIAGSAASLRNEFTTEMNSQIQQNKTRLESQQAQRDQLMTQLDEAQKAGQTKLADSLSQQLGDVRNQINLTKTNYLNSLSQANEQARLAEQSTRQNVTTFTGMVDNGAVMTPAGISSMAKTLNIPFDVANDYYQSAENIRSEKGLSLQEQKIKLEDLKFGFDEKIQGIRGEQAQAVNDFSKLAKSGNYTEDQLNQFAVAMNIPNDRNPLYQSKVGLEAAQAKLAELDAKYKYSTPPVGTKDYLEYKKAELELQIAEQDNAEYTGNVPETDLKSVFYQPGKSDYGHGEGKRECGEGSNDIIEGTKVGNSYASKMAVVKKKEDPQVGNQFVIPLASGGGLVKDNATQPGHIETVISTNPLAGTFKTVSWNRDGNGTQTIQTYNLADLPGKYGSNWGFSNSKLKSEYAGKLGNLSTQTSINKSGGEVYNKYYQQGLHELDMKPSEAKKYAQENAAKDLKESGSSGTNPEVESVADDAANGLITYSQMVQGAGKDSASYKTAFSQKIKSLADQEKDPIIKKMILSRAKGDPDSTTDQSWTKASQGFNQVLDLKQTLDNLTAKGKTGVLSGRLSKLDILDPDVALLKSQLAGVIPTVARGTFGEVGVLTDADIENYQKVVGDMDQTPEQINNATNNLIKTIFRNYSSSIESSPKNTSNRIDQYKAIKSKLPSSLKNELGVDQMTPEEKAAQTKKFLDFGASLIGTHQKETGKYIVPEDHPINQFDF